jgi:hypothetical protein
MMTRFSSRGSPVRDAVEVGDYFAALGVAREAKKLDIDVAAAQLARRRPAEARLISAVAGVLNHSQWRDAYVKACTLRDSVLEQFTSRYGESLARTVPDLRQRVWTTCCQLLQLDLDSSEPPVGPRGLASLMAEGGQWVAESVLDATLALIQPTASEVRGGIAAREFWYADCPACGDSRLVACRLKRDTAAKPDADRETPNCRQVVPCDHFNQTDYDYHVLNCRNCHSPGGLPTEYQGTYKFTLPATWGRGTVVEGECQARGGMVLAVVEGVTMSRSLQVLRRFHKLQHEGEDVTVDEASWRMVRDAPTIPLSVSEDVPHQAWWQTWFSLPAFLIAMGLMSVMTHGNCRASRSANRPSAVAPSHSEPARDSAGQLPPGKEGTSGQGRAWRPLSLPAAGFAVSIAETMAKKNPDDPRAQVGLAMGYTMLGQSYAAENRTEDAMEYFQKTIDLVDQLLANHPDCIDCFQHLGRAHNGMGNEYRKMKNPCAAAEHIQKSVEAFEELRRRSATPAKSDVEYSMVQIHLALIKTELHQCTEAIGLLESARPRLEAVLRESPSDAQVQQYLRYIIDIEAKARKVKDITSS